MLEISYRTLTSRDTWIYPDGYDLSEARRSGQVQGWFYNYRGVPAYHGPFTSKFRAARAAVLAKKLKAALCT